MRIAHPRVQELQCPSNRSPWTLLERLEHNVCWKMSEASSTIAASERSFLGRSVEAFTGASGLKVPTGAT